MHVIQELQKEGELLPTEVLKGLVVLCTTCPTFVKFSEVSNRDNFTKLDNITKFYIVYCFNDSKPASQQRWFFYDLMDS